MKFKLSVVIATLIASSIAFAHGVEKVLPANTYDVKVKNVELGSLLVGQKLISEWGGEDGGPVYENIYEPRLEVVVAYDVKGEKFVSSDDGGALYNGGKPYLTFYFNVSPQTITAIKAKTVKASSLVSYKVISMQVEVPDDRYQYRCRYDNDSNQKIEDGCQELPQPKVKVNRPVLSLDVSG